MAGDEVGNAGDIVAPEPRQALIAGRPVECQPSASRCGDPYYPRYGYSQPYYSPSGYGYAPPNYAYVPASDSSYSSRSDYYRNYNGIHAAPERYP